MQSINKENILWKNKKIFNSITPFTLLDFHSYPSAILWFSGCDMRCSFCYNKEIVENKGIYSFNQLEEFLITRKSLLKGIVLCGGEPTIHPEILDIVKTLKQLNYKIKLDTNGLHPLIVKELINQNLVDFIALDFKAPKIKFTQVTKAPITSYNQFLKTLEILIKSNIDFEIRTTFHNLLLNVHDIYEICNILEQYNYSKTYYIQNFMNYTQTIGNITNKNRTNLSKIIDDSSYNFKIQFRNFDLNQGN